MTTPPLSIWLQTDEHDFTEVTWCEDQTDHEDIEYVHAGEIRRSLMGHKSSQLWGDNGLIAATMRCVNTLDDIEDLIVDADCTAEEVISKIRTILGKDDPEVKDKPKPEQNETSREMMEALGIIGLLGNELQDYSEHFFGVSGIDFQGSDSDVYDRAIAFYNNHPAVKNQTNKPNAST